MGQVIKVNITNGGEGYDSAPTVRFTGGSPDTVATATAVLTGGVVTSIVITNPGAGYESVPTVTFTGGTPETPATAVAVIAPINYNADEIFFIDSDEASLKVNKDKGISGAGWYIIKEDTVNNTWKTECLVAVSSFQTLAEAGDSDGDDIPNFE